MTPNEEPIVKSIPVRVIAAPDVDEDIELTDSIKTHSLFHPVTVQRLPFNGVEDQYELVAGKKRLKSIKALNHTQINALIFPPNLSPEEIKEKSLHENLRRFNLQWYDIAEQREELHNLRIKQHGQRANGKRTSEGWSIRDTARELNKSAALISEDITLAKALRENPSLKKVKDRDTAIKLIREIGKRENSMLESQLPDIFEMNQVFCGDSLEILKSLPGAVFDACITDPPWIEYKDEKLIRDESTIAVFKEVYRVLKPNSLLYAVMSITDFFTYQTELPKFGFTVQKWPLIWAKSGTMTHGRRGWEYARDFEPILLAAKGSPALTMPNEISAIFSEPAVPSVKLVHPHEKPIELLKRIISHCTYDGGKILDPFAGSGVTLEAARSLGRKYIGIERDHKFFKNIERRLA